MTLEFSQQIFEKSSNIKFYENPPNGSRVVPCGRTDRHDEANSRFFSILRTSLKMGKQWVYYMPIKEAIIFGFRMDNVEYLNLQ